MIEAIKVFILAVVQGIGEFLPISSSGHLLVFGKFLFGENGLDEGDFLTLGILLHAGTLISILIVFWRDIYTIFRQKENWRVLAMLAAASIPTAAVGFLIKEKYPSLEENLIVTGFGFLATAFLLISVLKEKKTEKNDAEQPEGKRLNQISLADALFIGLFQGIAVLPGFSRSGFTISAALLRKISRRDAAVFSFLLAIPAIGGVALLETADLLKTPEVFTDPRMILWLAASAVSCAVGIISLVWLLKWLRSGALERFAWWLIPLGIIVLAVTFGSMF